MATTTRSEERRLITSVFIDVVGSTDLTVTLGPERMKAALDQAFGELRAIIEREGGTVEKYIGDAIYALFGAPLTHSDDPERALRAAAGARAWAASRSTADIPFGVRIGLETGDAIVDLAAAADTKQQMSVGAVVNTAARLQQRAEPGQVLVGPVAHEATSEHASFTSLGTIELKGLGAIEVWLLDDVGAGAGRHRLPFVGREAELELLRLAQRRAKTRSVLALVSGPPGQGKTRLVEELLASASGTRILMARCRPGGEVGALAPLRELLVGDRGEAALEVLVAEAIDVPEERVRLQEALAHAAGIRASSALAGLGKDERDDEILNAWRRLVRGLAARGPLALWIEDVHWAAPEVVALVDRLSLAGEPVLVVATARPEFATEAGLRPSGDRFFIELEGLEPDAAASLAASAGGKGDAVRRAEGNPLFIVELARTKDTSGALPLTLQGALGARLDDLDAHDRALLAHAAVIGETFSSTDVAFLAAQDRTSTARDLTRLADTHYLELVDDRYRFHHSLLRDVAYGRLLVADRMRLHARYARERADGRDEEVLAYHWWAALGGPDARWVWQDDPQLPAMRELAFRVHLAAGRRQGSLFAAERAAGLFERALALAADEAQRGAAQHALADAYAQDLRADESWAAYGRAQAHYAAAGAVPLEVYLGALKVKLRAGAFRSLPSAEETGRLREAALAAARAAGDRGALARVLVYTAFDDMDPTTAKGDSASMAEALTLIEDSDDSTRREILGWYANDLIRDHKIDRAVAVLDEVESLPGAVSELDRMELIRGRAALAEQRGDLADLRTQAAAMTAISSRMGPHLRTHADSVRATAAVAAADWRTVLELATATDRLMQSSPATTFCSSAGMLLARGALVHAREGRPDEARALARRIASISGKEGPRMPGEHLPLMTALALLFTGPAADRVPATAQTTHGPLPWSAVVAVASRQREAALAIADRLHDQSTNGARFYAALAQAIGEEVARDSGGPAPTHALLREIGYVGWSELLSARA